MSIAEVKNLTKTYPSFKLDNISFRLEEGKITGFIGRNGAGKTTTIKSMLNLVHCDSGSVEFFGMPLNSNESQIKKRIGYSSGTVNWYPKKAIGDIACITKRFYDTWDENVYRKYMKMFELDESKSPSELSEGMKVKFNLLLALSHGAMILILDEPTSGLDPFSRDELLDIFEELKHNGTSIFFSTHITSDIEKCADNILYLSKGRIEADSGKEDFISSFCHDGETLEQAILRLERSGRND